MRLTASAAATIARVELDLVRSRAQVREWYPRAGMPWSRAEERILERGGSIRTLAKRVGRTEEAVRARLSELKRCARRILRSMKFS